MTTRRIWLSRAFCAAALTAAALSGRGDARAQGAAPQILDPSLRVRTVVSGLALPISLAFLAPDDMLVLENDPRLEDRVADNLHKWEITESESLLIGRTLGIGTDIQTGLNGSLFVVSLSNGAVYEIYRR